jgi:hypothetical protein
MLVDALTVATVKPPVVKLPDTDKLPAVIPLVIVSVFATAESVTDREEPVSEYVTATEFADIGPGIDIALNEGVGLTASTH